MAVVLDGSEESNKWRTWIEDHPDIPGILQSRAVAMSLESESEEANYLKAFCPITSLPLIVMIRFVIWLCNDKAQRPDLI